MYVAECKSSTAGSETVNRLSVNAAHSYGSAVKGVALNLLFQQQRGHTRSICYFMFLLLSLRQKQSSRVTWPEVKLCRCWETSPSAPVYFQHYSVLTFMRHLINKSGGLIYWPGLNWCDCLCWQLACVSLAPASSAKLEGLDEVSWNSLHWYVAAQANLGMRSSVQNSQPAVSGQSACEQVDQGRPMGIQCCPMESSNQVTCPPSFVS